MLKEWKAQAKKAGEDKDGQSYFDAYIYHLGMMTNPLPFRRWKMKYDSLVHLQSIPDNDPRYYAESTIKREQALCNELGY